MDVSARFFGVVAGGRGTMGEKSHLSRGKSATRAGPKAAQPRKGLQNHRLSLGMLLNPAALSREGVVAAIFGVRTQGKSGPEGGQKDRGAWFRVSLPGGCRGRSLENTSLEQRLCDCCSHTAYMCIQGKSYDTTGTWYLQAEQQQTAVIARSPPTSITPSAARSFDRQSSVRSVTTYLVRNININSRSSIDLVAHVLLLSTSV